jgi:hypothetical protein
VEFRLDEQRKPQDVTILQAEPRPDEQDGAALRLSIGAERAIKDLQFDQSDRTQPDTRHPYRVTVILCLDPGGHCGDIMPFPHTTPVMVKEKPYPPVDFPIS